MDTIISKLNFARKELLDLSFRNPLLNFKLRKTTGLQFNDLNIYDVFDYLVVREKPIQFTTENSLNHGRLFVNISTQELHNRLNQTYRQSVMFLEEKGANTLFLALGFLSWIEDENRYLSPLVLVPVSLSKNMNSDRYTLSYSKDDIQFNISLQTKLKLDFNIDLEIPDNDEFSFNDYFKTVNESISLHNDFEISYIGALDFFSYGKYLMYQDLDIDKWILNDRFINEKVIKGLLVDGFNEPASENVDVDEITRPSQFFHVVDADSSQALAIYDVNKGRNLVMQGPPGTGKSQTITNIIANSVALGKKVLFVAEKASALDVVNRRLKAASLDSLVLELHSHKANKKDVLKAISDTLNLGEPKISDSTPLYSKYEEVKGTLNSYRDVVNKPIFNSQLTPINVYGSLMQLKEKLDSENIKLPRIHIDGLDEYNDQDFYRRYDACLEFVNSIKNIGKLEKHPFYGVQKMNCLPFEQVAIKEKLIALDDSLSELGNIISEIQKLLNIHYIDNIFEANRISNSITISIKDIDLLGINVNDYRFFDDPEYILDVIEKGKQGKQLYDIIKDKMTKAYSFKEFIDEYNNYSSISLLHFKRRKMAYNELLKYTNDHKIIDKIYQYSLIYSFFETERKNIIEIFKGGYQGIVDTKWDEILMAVRYACDIHKMIANYQIIPQIKTIFDNMDDVSRLIELNSMYQDALTKFNDDLCKAFSMMEFDFGIRFGYPKWYIDYSFTDIKKMINQMMDTSRINEIVMFNDAKDKMEKLGLTALIEPAVVSKNVDHLPDILLSERLMGLVDYAFKNEPVLGGFKRFTHERAIETFKELDMAIMLENIKYIIKYHWDHCPKINDTTPEMNIIRRELQKNKNQMSIRKLLSKTGDTIQAIKPVFMMSPLSIASYLEPGKMSFDLVIFDEASQVRPVEAFGALLRANQIVVVGDSKQLPPTNFFDTMTTKYEGMTDEDYDISNMESILSLLVSKNIPSRTLNWHYRSRHKSLIMISNEEFYDNRLCVFPSADDLDVKKGVIFNYLPNTIYQRGKTRTNPLEAKEVIKKVFEHAEKYPDKTLGVVSFSMAQENELYHEFERQMKKNTNKSIENYFHMHEDEPFFIKNLENVQGDERDVIFISLGYGYDENHNLTMDFGPLNKDGGERRLNVLITRAREKTEVFSNITGYDINLARTQSVGVRALKKYLDYAQSRLSFDDRNKATESNEFVDYIYNRLVDYGYRVDKNVGIAGFGIDLAIVDAENENHYILGIECDSGAYSNSASATDRDRLRNQVLTRLGWKMYHIWSTEFYRNPKLELEKLLNYINNIANIKETKPRSMSLEIKRGKSEKLNENEDIIDYKLYNGPKRRVGILDEIDSLKALIIKIVDTEAPIHVKEIMNRIAYLTQVNKLTEKYKRNIMDALLLLGEAYEIKNDFVYKLGNSIKVRRRSELSNKKVEFIPYDEIKLLCYLVIDLGLATALDEIKGNVAQIFGFTKNNQSLNKLIMQALNEMIEDSSIYVENEDLYYINDYKEV